ncbi:transmembrane protein 39A [Onthophagus taurus]|uniref:transmembrane protein 39A n=1 Tax=Onthophagus taurus TaxID=166361 RepID=UPI0039BE6AB1
MPGGGRRIPRTVRSSITPSLQLLPGDLASSRYSPLGGAVPTLPGLEHPVSPKHFPFPNTPISSDILFECLMYFFTLGASGLQFVHLYRSVWWLPNSYTNQSVNFYLIDINLVLFIGVVLARRLLYVLGCKLIDRIIPGKFVNVSYNIFRLLLFIGMFSLLSWCTYKIMLTNHIMYICYLCYPIVVYVILFGFKIVPFFELISWNPDEQPPLHACTTNATDIRNEVENLKTNFNNRLKQILFSSIFNAHYAGLVPCCFVQSYVYYDVYWVTQHVLFIYLGCFMSYTIHVLTLRYCDVLHRSALHLGFWDRIESRSVLPVAYSWQEDYLWPNGALVRHGKEMYRAYGESNAAEPGNTTFTRFYFIFKDPSAPLGWLLILQVSLICYQLALLVRSIYWYCIVSLVFLLFFNYYTLFKIARDYLVSMKVYKTERNLHEKVTH